MDKQIYITDLTYRLIATTNTHPGAKQTLRRSYQATYLTIGHNLWPWVYSDEFAEQSYVLVFRRYYSETLDGMSWVACNSQLTIPQMGYQMVWL